MFLSKLVLNIGDRQVRWDLARPYEMHRSLWRAFPENDLGRILYRVDADRASAPPVVLVQSDLQPQWERLEERAPRYLIANDCKRFHPSFIAGQRLRFRLRANPTKKVAAKNERLGSVMVGKRVGLVTEADQVRWLLRKALTGGFRILGQWLAAKHPETQEPIELPNFRVTVVPEGRDRNSKPGHAGEFVAIRFDGILEVTDPDLFHQTVAAGIGSAKAFGFGLLSLARAEN